MSDLVSIVMPNYNGEKYLKDAIDSVVSQTFSNWELLFVDDCSTDRSVDIVKAYRDERIRIFRNNRNCGAAISRNYAIRESRGRWIAFLDSDDYWFPSKLEKQIRFMEENCYQFSYTKYYLINEDGNEIGLASTGPAKITKTMMYTSNYLGCLTVMFDKNYIGMVQIENLKKRNDYAFWLKICKKADCYYLNESLAKYRLRSGSMSHQGKFDLFRHQYKLFRFGEHINPVASFSLALINCFFWFVKKLFYIKKYKQCDCN